MNKNIFLTGFPGFIASRLIPHLIEQRPESKIYLLVQKKYLNNVFEQLKKLENDFKFLRERLIPVEGDLTIPEILSDRTKVYINSISEIFNLAAVYDLRVDKDLAYRVNVDGTEHLVEFAKLLPNLDKFHHISTCYVAGWYEGEFSESDFDKGQSFKNYYEETKFLSEKIIRENKANIPFVIYRPSIVVGDSNTGETSKFDGPYPVIFLVNKLPKLSLMTQVGGGANPVNLIPVDYVVKSLAALSTLDSKFVTYHLCDPEPLSQIQIIEIFGKLLNKKLFAVKIKPDFIKGLLKFPLLQELTGLYPEMIDYFDHKLILKCDVTLNVLEHFNIEPPKFSEYVKHVIDFALKNKNIIAKKGLW